MPLCPLCAELLEPPVHLLFSNHMLTFPRSHHADEETIAHLLPCKHDLHNACLKPWVERANSCPICRTAFNMVELSCAIGGPVIESYAVQDKVQQAEIDAAMVIEDELFAVETWEPCMVCGTTDDVHEVMYCDGCDKAVHVFCAGHEESPNVWHCENCLAGFEPETGFPRPRPMRRQPRRRNAAAPHAAGTRRRRNNDAIWASVWQEVSRQLDLDLDFPFDEEPVAQRTDHQQRELNHWTRRLEVADEHGARARLRDIANARLNPARAPVQPEPESQEEIRAWNAFNKARESQDAPASVQRRKRKTTASPASPRDAGAGEQPQLKRPRLRKRRNSNDHQQAAESSATAQQRGDDRSTFLASLLKDVETKPMPAASPGASDLQAGQYSPGNSSPVRSPTSSGHVTPRALSPTPPPQRPTPLSSIISPLSSPRADTFSPFSPTAPSPRRNDADNSSCRGRQRESDENHPIDSEAAARDRASSTSPSRNLSYSAKEEIQRMVKLALRPRYQEKEINKDQYTNINRDISRRMYDMVIDASALTDSAERERWQSVAEEEVRKAIAMLHFGPPNT